MKFKWAAALILIFGFVNLTTANIHNNQSGNSSTRTAKELVASKNILIIDLLEEELRITEIFHLLNSTDHAIDLKETPISKTLPSAAFNIRYLGHNRAVAPEISSGQLVFAHKVPPGEQRLFFSYNLPVNAGSVSLTHFFPLDTKEFELIGPEKTFEVSIEAASALQHPMVSRKKKFENYIYDSKTLLFNNTPQKLRFMIQNIPLPQNKLFYPAAAGCVLIFLSLFWYLKRKA